MPGKVEDQHPWTAAVISHSPLGYSVNSVMLDQGRANEIRCHRAANLAAVTDAERG